MPSRTSIEWADYSSNPIKARDPKTNKRGHACIVCAPECENCYAQAINRRFGTGHKFNAQALKQVEISIDDRELRRMLTFKPRGPFKNGRTRPVVFVEDMSDLFGSWVTDDMIDRVLAACALRPDVDWLLLTKRPERMAENLLDSRDMLGFKSDERARAVMDRWDEEGVWGPLGKGFRAHLRWPLHNVWLGFSAGSQKTFDASWPHFKRLGADGWFTWCSAEPMLGPIDLPDDALWEGSRLKWLVAGGESGPAARPMHPDWPRRLRDQLDRAEVPFFFKQWGEWSPDYPDGLSMAHRAETYQYGRSFYRVGKKLAGRALDRVLWSEIPCSATPSPASSSSSATAPRRGASRRSTAESASSRSPAVASRATTPSPSKAEPTSSTLATSGGR